jgi:hypothetical protein
VNAFEVLSDPIQWRKYVNLTHRTKQKQEQQRKAKEQELQRKEKEKSQQQKTPVTTAAISSELAFEPLQI